MNKNRMTKKARFLFGLWCALYAMFNVGSRIYVSYQQVFNNVDPTQLLSGFHLFTLATIALFFLPSLFGINHLMKQDESPKLKKAVRWLLIIFSMWTLAMTLITIVSVIMPGVLA